MYDVLRDFAQRQDVAGFISGFLSETLTEESVQGVHVGIDQYWCEGWITIWQFHNAPYYPNSPNFDLRIIRTFTRDFHVDFDYRPPEWDGYCRSRGFPEGSNPFYIKFILRHPLTAPEKLPRSWEGYPLIYEYRPPCIALSAQFYAGSSIGLARPNPPGTAGGFLQDSNTGKNYLLTCAHVLNGTGGDVYHPSPHDSWFPTMIGNVAVSTLPPPKGIGMYCNPFAVNNAGTVDLAIAGLDDINVTPRKEIPRIGQVSVISSKSKMSQGDKVVFYGKTSGLVEAELGSLGIWHEILIDNQPHCFSYIFELTHRRPYYINTDLARGGDSGSWILNITNNIVSWDGMLIAGDGAQAYGCFAEDIKAKCESELNTMLRLLP
jgi:hypothetical protein